MNPLVAIASALIAAATVAWIVSHGRREVPMRPDWREPEDGVQPADPCTEWRTRWSAVLARGETQTNSPAWERGEVSWRCSRCRSTGLYPQAWPA